MSNSSLRSALDALASSFTDSILAAIRSASLENLHAESGGEVPRILRTGLASKKLKAKGQKRATTYTAP